MDAMGEVEGEAARAADKGRPPRARAMQKASERRMEELPSMGCGGQRCLSDIFKESVRVPPGTSNSMNFFLQPFRCVFRAEADAVRFACDPDAGQAAQVTHEGLRIARMEDAADAFSCEGGIVDAQRCGGVRVEAARHLGHAGV